MGKYIHKYTSLADFTAAYNGQNYLEPWVSATVVTSGNEETITVNYNKKGSYYIKLTDTNSEYEYESNEYNEIYTESAGNIGYGGTSFTIDTNETITSLSGVTTSISWEYCAGDECPSDSGNITVTVALNTQSNPNEIDVTFDNVPSQECEGWYNIEPVYFEINCASGNTYTVTLPFDYVCE